MIENTIFQSKKVALGVATAIAFSLSSLAYAEAEKFEFNIKEQAVAPALMELSALSGVHIMLADKVGKINGLSGLRGEYTLTAALDAMLEGTGLVYEFISDDSVVVKEGEIKKPAGEKDNENNVEEMIVTGSRLINDPGKMTRQIDTFSREDIENSGVLKLDEFLRRLPQNVNAPTSVASGTALSRKDFGLHSNVYGGSGINLRGLGSQYTLLLIDGRRPAKGGFYGDTFDISSISLDRVERIEILYDGAAAIYGADAIGGVINIVTNREFEGTQVTASIAGTQDGGGERVKLGIGHTFSWDTGNATAQINVESQKKIEGNTRDIEFAPLPVFGLAPDSTVIYPGTPGNVGVANGARGGIALMFVYDLNGDGDTMDDGERIPGGTQSLSTSSSWPDGKPNLSGTTSLPPVPGVSGAYYFPVATLQMPEMDSDTLSLFDIVENTSAPLPSPSASAEEITAAMQARFPMGDSVWSSGQGFSLQPEEDIRSFSLHVNQEFGENVIANLSYNYTETDRASNSANDTHKNTIDRNHTLPFGVKFHHAYADGLPQTFLDVNVKTHNLSGNWEWQVNEDWSARLSAGASRNVSESLKTNAFINVFNQTSLLKYGDYARAEDGKYYLTPTDLRLWKPNFGFESYEAYLAASVDPEPRGVNTTSRTNDVELQVTGVVAELPAGDVRANISLNRLSNHTSVVSEEFNDRFLVGFDQNENGNWVEESYSDVRHSIGGEVVAPITSTVLLNAAMRSENYSNTDLRGKNWATGINWEALDWLTVRLNRTYSTRVPDAVIQKANPWLYNGTRAAGWLYTNLDPNNRFNALDYSRERSYHLHGGTPGLRPEGNYGTAFGLIIRPSEELDLQVNYSQSKTIDQIGEPLVDINYTAPEIANYESNPFLNKVTGDGTYTVDGQVIDLNYQGLALTGDAWVLDRRYRNIGNTLNKSIDMSLRYVLDTDIGEWTFNYAHQYMMESILDRVNFCTGGVCQNQLNPGSDAPVDIVGEVDLSRNLFSSRIGPLPEHRGTLQLGWSYRGMVVNAYTTMQSKTSVVETDWTATWSWDTYSYEYKFNKQRITTTPPTKVDVSMSYVFDGDLFRVPSWLKDMRLNMTVHNAFYKNARLKREMLQQEFDPGHFDETLNFSPYAVDPRGRAYTLTLSKMF